MQVFIIGGAPSLYSSTVEDFSELYSLTPASINKVDIQDDKRFGITPYAWTGVDH